MVLPLIGTGQATWLQVGGGLEMADSNLEEQRKVGFWLGLGIFFMPYIFAWFTLRNGYSSRARYVALGWLGIMVLPPLLVRIHQASMSPDERIEEARQHAQDELGISTAASARPTRRGVGGGQAASVGAMICAPFFLGPPQRPDKGRVRLVAIAVQAGVRLPA